MAKINKTIRFEDHGQDFLEWDIKDDVVVECRPFQGSVWCGCTLVPQVIEPGVQIRLITKHGDPLELRYPIAEVIEPKQPFTTRHVKCCRCRHRHLESDRISLPSKEWKGAENLCCPRCNAHTYWETDENGHPARPH